MAFKFEFSTEAQNNLQTLDGIVAKRILKKIVWFSAQNDPTLFTVQLHGVDSDNVRFRIGDYRVVATIHKKQKQIVVVRIGHRSDTYR